MIKGIDISSWQSGIQWDKVKTSGVDFAIIRAGYGNSATQKDKEFTASIEGALAAGVQVGVYWFGYATSAADAKKEANVCDSIIKPYKSKLSLPVFYDWEYDSYNYAVKQGVNPTKTLITNINIAFMDEIKKLGYETGYYTNLDYLKSKLDKSKLQAYKLWLAYYSEDKADAYMQQYTSSGNVDGINGNVDMNYLYEEIKPVKPAESVKTDVIYQTWDDVLNKWLPNVKNTEDYAGIFGHDVCAVYANTSSGNITTRVHYKGGRWLPAVTNRSDFAGIYNRPIDGIMVKSDVGTAHIRAHIRGGDWLPWVTGYDSEDSNNGYAGVIGKEIDAIQIYID